MERMIVKSKLLASVEREQEFINEMNQKGYRLVSIWSSNRYRFQETTEEHFTIVRAVPKERVAELSKAAEENGYTCIPHSLDGMGNFLYLDGVRGISNEAFLSDEADIAVHKEKVHQYYRWTSVTMLLMELFFLGLLFWLQMENIPNVLQIRDTQGAESAAFWISAVAHGVGTLLIAAGEVFSVWYTAVLCRLWYRSAKEKGKGKRVLLVQVLLWLLVIPLLLGIYLVMKPEVEDDDEPTLEDLREQVVLFEDYTPSTEKLGECYYFYGEYESDLLFEDVKPLLEEKGYRLEDVGHLLEEGNDNPYYGAGNDTTGAGIWLVECATEEEAKKVYTAAMECSWEYDYRMQANFHYTITRMGRMVYGTVDTGAAFSDLMGIYDLPLPEPTPLYKGGTYTYWKQVDYEQALTTARRLRYTSFGYNELLDEAPIVDCRNYLTPDGRGYLSIVKLTTLEEGFEGELPEDDPVVLYAYQTVAKVLFDLFGHGLESESAKYVMLSEDTFIAGTSYYVDAFIAELERSTTFEAYAPSAEKIGEQYYLYEEYESDLLLEDVEPFFEERGYDIRDLSKRLGHQEDTCYYSAQNEETGVHVVMMECKTEERAKKVFEQIMARDRSHVFLAEPWDSSVVVRVGRTIFGTLCGDQGVQDIFEACNLTLPTPVPLYKGGLYTYGETVTFERALEEAKKEKYELGGRGANFFESTENLPFERVRYIVTPDHKGFLCIGQLARLWAENLPEKLYVSLDEQGKEAMKYVMLSGGTFIAGTSYYVDAFIAELEE